MLVLSRHAGQQIVITLEDQRQIIVTVCGIKDGVARIGILADKTIGVLRDDAHVKEPKAQA